MPSRRGFAGFGLIAILVVLAIVLILYFGVGGSGGIAQQAQQTRSTARELQYEIMTSQLTPLIVIYYQNNNKLPTTFEEMEAPPQSWADRWGNPLTFTIKKDPRTGRQSVTYRSAGPDGEVGTADDITRTDDLPV
ncbi:MAG: type II secretion system protein [Phycisphaerales bacterium]|nr:type II secretion system protein [Phycisphaerales bacterium]